MATPDLAEVLRQAIESRLADVHTCLPGRVVSYDRRTQQADVELVVRSAVEATDGGIVNESLPVLPAVPVMWPRGGGCSLQLPLSAGDHVWVMFSEGAIGNWRVSGQTSDPGDIARHSLSYPVALPCAAPDTEPLTEAGESEVALDVPGGKFARVGGSEATAVAIASKAQSEIKKLATLVGTALGQITGPVVTTTAAATMNAHVVGDTGAQKLRAE